MIIHEQIFPGGVLLRIFQINAPGGIGVSAVQRKHLVLWNRGATPSRTSVERSPKTGFGRKILELANMLLSPASSVQVFISLLCSQLP
ncbi:hypothetical protein D3C71_1904080 [compost metagenome]